MSTAQIRGGEWAPWWQIRKIYLSDWENVNLAGTGSWDYSSELGSFWVDNGIIGDGVNWDASTGINWVNGTGYNIGQITLDTVSIAGFVDTYSPALAFYDGVRNVLCGGMYLGDFSGLSPLSAGEDVIIPASGLIFIL